MIPLFAASGACAFAWDFIGFGHSDKPVDDAFYKFARYSLSRRCHMFANISAVYHGLAAISRFEQGPDTLPYSSPLVTSVLSAYALVKIGIAFLTMPVGVAFISGLVDTLLSVTIVAGVLAFRRFPNRIIQTLTAFAGIGTAINLVAFVGMSFVNLSPHHLLETYVPRVFTVPLMFWNLAINAHIFRHALSTRFVQGLGLALLIAAASGLLTTMIHPAIQPATLGVGALGQEAR